MNKKERHLALYSIISSKLRNNEILVIDTIQLKAIRTQDMAAVFAKLPYEKNCLFALSERNDMIEKSSANLPYVKSIQVSYLNVADLLKYKTLVLLRSGVEALNTLAQ
jgi:large subunit ribosomal protein L4